MNEKKTKECKNCGIEKKINEFYKKLENLDGITNSCIECYKKRCKVYYNKNKEERLEYSRNYRKNNKEKTTRSKRQYYNDNKEILKEKHKKYNDTYKLELKNKQLLYNYGISLEDYNKKAKDQNYKCLICLQNEKLVVDHCHFSGSFRGLLCGKCNTGLGYFRDNEDVLLNAIQYLRNSKAR